MEIRAGGWHARDHQLCEQSVDMFTRFEAFKPRDLLIQIHHLLDQSFFFANHVDTMRIKESRVFFFFFFFKFVLGE